MNTTINKCLLVIYLALLSQSLADVAREEAERRGRLEEQGVEAKVITDEGARTSRGNISSIESSSPRPQKPARSDTNSSPSTSQSSARSYRSALQKLDRAMQKDEQRLKLWRERLQSLRREMPNPGKMPTANKPNENREKRLKEEIEEIELRLKQLRRERSDVYESGRKAGLLPGELEGKGIVP